MITKKQTAAVARGAKLLDKRVPGWARKVKLTMLNIASSANCVLGQLFEGSYGQGARELFSGGSFLASYENEWRQSIRHGFLAPTGNIAALTEAWKDQVRARRAGLPVETMRKGK